MISICASDCSLVLFLLIFNEPGLNEGRYVISWPFDSKMSVFKVFCEQIM